MPDQNLVEALGEIKAVLKRRDIMGVVFIASPTHGMHLHELSPSWSCITFSEGNELRFRSKLEDYPSREAQKKTQEETIGSLLGFCDVISRVKEDFLKLLVVLGNKLDIEHMSKWEPPDSYRVP